MVDHVNPAGNKKAPISWGPNAKQVLTYLDIEISNQQRIRLNKLTTRLYRIAH